MEEQPNIDVEGDDNVAVPGAKGAVSGNINIACLVDARKEYIDIIVSALLPHVQQFVKALVRDAESLKAQHPTLGALDVPAILRRLLQEVHHWTPEMLQEQVEAVEAKVKHLQSLLHTTFKCNYMILAAIHTDGSITIPLRVPSTATLVHEVYKKVAAEFEEDAVALLHVQPSKLRGTLDQVIREALRELMPMQELLTAIRNAPPPPPVSEDGGEEAGDEDEDGLQKEGDGPKEGEEEEEDGPDEVVKPPPVRTINVRRAASHSRPTSSWAPTEDEEARMDEEEDYW